MADETAGRTTNAAAAAGGDAAAGPSRRLCAGGYANEEYSSDSDDAPLIDPGNSSPDDGDEDDGLARDGGSVVRIRIPEEERRGDPHQRYPKERGKTLLAVAMLFVAGVSNVIVLSVVHEKVPEQDPLPDFIFSLTPYYPYGLNITEYIMLSSFAAMAVLILFHRHRWIVLRRLATIGSLCYFFRCVTMFVTQVPVADPNWHCSPKLKGENATFANVLIRALSVLTGLGLNIGESGEKHTLCGDYIYSGHTIVLTISALFIGQYSPRRWRIVHAFSWLISLTAMFLLIMSRGHYTIDVIISYVVCTRLFYMYHTMAAMPSLRISPQNHHRKEIWWRLFEFMEGRMMRPLPRRYDNPFPLRACIALIRPGGNTAAAANSGGAAGPTGATASVSTPLLPGGGNGHEYETMPQSPTVA